MAKHSLKDYEKNLVEHFLYTMYEHHGDFGWEDFYEYRNNYGYHIYNLVNHKAFVVVMTKGPFPDESIKERFAFTEKGLLVYDFGSYDVWEKYDEKRIQFIKSEFTRSKLSLRIAIAAIVISFFSGMVALLGYLQNRNHLKHISKQSQIVAPKDTTLIKLVDLPNLIPLKIDTPHTAKPK